MFNGMRNIFFGIKIPKTKLKWKLKYPNLNEDFLARYNVGNPSESEEQETSATENGIQENISAWKYVRQTSDDEESSTERTDTNSEKELDQNSSPENAKLIKKLENLTLETRIENEDSLENNQENSPSTSKEVINPENSLAKI